MISLEHEQNVELIREHALLFRDEIKRLNQYIADLKGAARDDSDQEWLSTQLKDQLVRLKKKFFGFGREALPTPEIRPVGHIQEKLKIHGKRWHKDQTETADPSQVAATRKNPSSFGNEITDYSLSDDALKQESELRGVPMSEDAWDKIKGLNQESFEISIVERVYKKVMHRQAKYRLKDKYNHTGKEVIITAPGPVKLKPGSQYSVDFALSVVSDKYAYHIPLERQRRKMEAAGLQVDVKTLYTLCQSVAEHCEKSVLPKIRRDILADFCATHVDECPWPIIGQDGGSYMWVLSNRVGSYYRFEPTRSGKIAQELLGDYKGSILTDAFSGYNRFKSSQNVRLGHCWSHARREFYERLDDYPKEVEEIVRMMDDLFAIESKPEDLDTLRQARRTEGRVQTEKIYQWLWETKTRFLPRESLTLAINYCLRHWKELTLFIQDLSVPLSNNDAERALRHVVMGRKNFAGSKTINGADTAATLYTVIESAKRVGLQPNEYLKYVITENWHKRDPKSPAEVSAEKFGKNDEIEFPPKDQWQI